MMSSECTVPKWNLIRQQTSVEGSEEGGNMRSSPHVQSNGQNLTYVVPMSNYEVTTELRWENGQVALNGLGHETSSKQTWRGPNLKAEDTLESLVHQATFLPAQQHDHHQVKRSSGPRSNADGKWRENPSSTNLDPLKNEERNRSSYLQNDDDDGGVKLVSHPILPISSSGGKWRQIGGDNQEKGVKSISMDGKYGQDSSPGGLVIKNIKRPVNTMKKGGYDQVDEGASERSGCASQSATFCRDHQTTDNTTMMTWPSFDESPPISSHAAPSENQEGEPVPNGESFRSQSSARSSRAAAVHNQSERRRRDRINQKMKALQKLVPNASKTDKASMLDEVIEYLKQLQEQIRMMSNARSIMPQMMMPLGMQQQIQMSYLARMGLGMGMGMGMVDVNNMARNVHHTLYPNIGHATPPPLGSTTAPSFLSPPFSMPPVVTPPTTLKANVDAAANTFVPNFGDAYKTLLAQQSMNMDFFNNMAALYRQQSNQQSNKPASISQPDNGQ